MNWQKGDSSLLCVGLHYLIESGKEAISILGTGQLRFERFVGAHFVSVFF